ncbi:translation termination inhibitor protein Itt1p [Monosporozyma unispora]|nr:translation termination inhibitor protein itt1 [Kazachstania unispora]
MTQDTNLKEDLQVLKDMYHELELFFDIESINAKTVLRGKLPFEMYLQNDHLTIQRDGCADLSLTKLPDNVLSFLINSEFYPSIEHGVKIAIKSSWMSKKDRLRIMDAINHEFGDMTDPMSESFESTTPILMLLFDFLINDASKIPFPKGNRHCESQEEYDKFKDLLNVVNKKEKDRRNFDCCICMETKKGVKMIKLPCSNEEHYLCTDCIKSYYTTMINEGQIKNVRCPECDYHEIRLETYQDFAKMKMALFTPSIPFEFFYGILPKETCERYKDLCYSQRAVMLSKYSPYSCCTCPRCEKWCIKDDLDDPMIECSNCNFTFCFDCLHSWHGYNNRCGKKVTIPEEILEEYIDETEENSKRRKELEIKYGKRVLTLAVSDYMAEKLLEIAINTEGSDLQRCPKCRCVVQRSEGCNRMKCEVCGALFCYLCGISLLVDDCYKHFRDPALPCYGRLFEGMPGTEDV